MEGPLGLTDCGVSGGLCSREDNCRIRPHWQRINQLIHHALAQVSLSDMNRARVLPNERDVRFME
jgi:DNA-binding IscR family transcriptional regulator